ncbi:B3/4 domain-containing protein [Streptomyces albidus (ex Kaewkla and Franco 2022)]|uniref:B3/B4 domain-containing protein n=1 Tax=Streptomyces albidus (ex Kaewkla and Franco 2022) TaxID=722709 RepID=UPI0015EF2471|nr:phenylalanine--tRNA ligase beta subunit-related protein [Streptomyces albidus (ex Kaewkla and Franco 2022)]
MADTTDAAGLRRWLGDASIDSAVTELRPDYRALLVAAQGLLPGPGDEFSESLLKEAEAGAFADPGSHPHVAAWHEAFRSFGAKPKRVRPSVDALLRRAPGGLPRVDRLTDIYNAVSVSHVLPVGGEDLDRYAGPARLVRADGTEPFEITAGGEEEVEHPRPGEVVWRDAAGVTCRRWNWRQCVRTRLTTGTTRAVFILDALGPMSDDALASAGEALTEALLAGSPGAQAVSRLLRASAPQD